MPVLTLFPGTPHEQRHRWEVPQCSLGRAPANNVLLDAEPVSIYHAKIERRGDEYWLVDLNSTNGTFLRGQRVREERLRHGDTGQFAEVVPFRFELAETEKTAPAELLPPSPSPAPPPAPVPVEPAATVPSALQTVGPTTPALAGGTQCAACRTVVPFPVNYCPRCGAPMGPATLPAPVTASLLGPGYVSAIEPPAGGVGVLPLLALLCGLSVIGFPFAILFGLMALLAIRRQGGFRADRRQALVGLGLGFVWATLFVIAGTLYVGHRVRVNREETLARVIAENESLALDHLRGIARAEKLAKAVRLSDPTRAGKGRYLLLEELPALGTSLVSHGPLTGRAAGYVYRVREPTEAGFEAVAEPERYGVTGRRTFTVDTAGVLRGQDLEGKILAQVDGALPVLTDAKPAFDGMDDAIAREAIAAARRLAEAGQYEECRRILDAIPEQFAMTTAAQELQALKTSVDPFIIEAQARGRYQKAQAALAAGDLRLGIGLLKEITELYPAYPQIAAITEELRRRQTELDQRLDKEAKGLVEQAETLERAGKPEAALELYVQVEKNFPGTDWARRIGDLRPAVQQAIREKGAEQLVAQARTLSAATQPQDIVNLLEHLQRDYADTTYVVQHRDEIVTLYQKALAQHYRALAIAQMDAGQNADALARLEAACASNPDLRPGFRDLFLKLYLRVARQRMDEGDKRAALVLCRQYLALEPEQSEVSPAVLAQLNLAVGKSEIALGRFDVAAQHLLAARGAFNQDPEYADLYATVQVMRGNYDEALPWYDRAIAAKPNHGNYYARRGYAQLVRALYIEEAAFQAFAGLLGANTAVLPAPTPDSVPSTPAPTTPATAPPTGRSNAPSASPVPAPAAGSAPPVDPGMNSDAAPVFLTELPLTAGGGRPEWRLRYDALASQTLLNEVLDLLKQIQELTSNSTSIKSEPDSSSGSTSSRAGIDRANLDTVRGGFELGNAVSAVHQKVLDHNSRKQRAADALRRMATLLANGNRDLNRALQLGTDRPAELVEILRATRQHEALLAEAAPKIAAQLAAEAEVIDRAFQITEAGYRNLRVQHFTAPANPAAGLEMSFSRLFDRRRFDEGLQGLRRAAGIKVPFDVYAPVPPRPVPPPTDAAPGPAALNQPAPPAAPAKSPAPAQSE